ITASSIARILQARGLKVTAMKIDPYVNVDAGTMNPVEHGEVFVLSDGLETDQDLGNYERFLNMDLPSVNYMTTGSIYLSVIAKERALEYKGKNVEVVPDIPNAVIEQIDRAVAKANADAVVVEVGGTLGEYQNILFLEAYRILKTRNPKSSVFVLVSYLPIQNGGELKSKPTQYAIRTANSAGIQPDFIIARAAVPIDRMRKEKIAFNCGIRPQDVISAPDVESIYEIPLNFEKDGLSDSLLEKLNLPKGSRDMKEWTTFVNKVKNAKKTVKVAIVGKYFSAGNFVLTDAYISVIEAVKQACAWQGFKPEFTWLDSSDFEGKGAGARLKELQKQDGVIVPGGFGTRAIEGKINVVQYCRENKIPYLGLCYGMQLMVVEYARHVAGLKGAHTTEVDEKTGHPVIDIMPEQKEILKGNNFGATMRLGNYPAKIKKGTVAYAAYKKESVVERHRHRYEVNPEYIEQIEKAGLVFSAASPDRRLMEMAELPKSKHPFFLGTQAHPELISRPLDPHPLFMAFIKASGAKNR
ncbi:MAG: CTP synthase, partial [Candidatus Harrisonbacteria bacterium CG10_big_fil_rev_8_21_14_0_10_49_15]